MTTVPLASTLRDNRGLGCGVLRGVRCGVPAGVGVFDGDTMALICSGRSSACCRL